MANTFGWNGGSGLFSFAGNWTDETSATAGPPTSADEADFFAISTGSTNTITGGGSALDMNFGGPGTWLLSDATLSATGNVAIGSSGAGTVSIGSGGTVLAGGRFNTVGDLAGSTGSLIIEAGGTFQETLLSQAAAFTFNIGRLGDGSVLVTGAGALLDTNNNPAGVSLNTGTASLTVAQGGTVRFGTSDSSVGNAMSAAKLGTAVITVTDPGSALDINGFAYLGRAGSGTLLVENHGSVASGLDAKGYGGLQIGAGSNTTAGQPVGGSGSATITSGGVLSSLQNITVGGNGVSGSLVVSDGGTVHAATQLLFGTSVTFSGVNYTGSSVVTVGAGGTLETAGQHLQGTADIIVGAGVGSTASLSVSGIGALLISNGDQIQIGQFGNGTLTVSNGGTVLSGTQYGSLDSATGLGAIASGDGTLRISDAGSTYTAVGALNVGNNGSGHLIVESGGALYTGDNTGSPASGFVVARSASGHGDATVTGTGSTLTNVGQFVVGENAAGSLAILNGASVTTSAPSGAGVAGAEIAQFAGSDGSSVTVSDAVWQVAGNLVLADAASGMLTVAAAGTVTADTLDIGVQAGAAGTLDLTDAGSRVVVAGTLNIGAAGGGVVAIGAGAAVTGAAMVNVGTLGSVTLLGGMLDPGAILNAGTIGGTGTLDSDVDNTSIIADGAGGTLEVTGTLSGSGTLTVGNGSTVRLDAAATGQTIDFAAATGTLMLGQATGFAGIINGFIIGDTIDLLGVTESIDSYGAGTLSLSGTVPLNLPLPGSFTKTSFAADTDRAGGTDITVACFLEGTRILTEAGEHEVERLEPGMHVVSMLHRKLLPVVWLGHRRLRASAHPCPVDVWPVRVCAGAFAPGEPHRDLLMSPDHAVFVDGVLVPVRYLINGTTIAQECRDDVTYFHVELAGHGVLLAEGLPAESYLDTGNRAAFENGGASVMAHPDFALRVWDARSCARLAIGGPAVVAVRERLHARAALLGHTSTDDAGLRVIVAGRVLPAEIDGRTWRVRLPPAKAAVHLLSRRWVPAQMRPGEDDHRMLGVALARLFLDGRMIALDDPRLSSGWHDCETGGGEDTASSWRWTDGDARLVLTDVRELSFDVVMSGRYRVAREAA